MMARRKEGQDAYARMARQAGYRSRAAYKLMQIDDKDRLFMPGQTVLDLGAAPGGWSQYAAQRVGDQGRVIALDMTPIKPIKGVHVLVGDAAAAAVRKEFTTAYGVRCCDLVLSDMAPALSGVRITDQVRSTALVELAVEWAAEVLHPAGTLLVKMFEGSESAALRAELKKCFRQVWIRKPEASKSGSREWYLLARLHVV